MKTSLKKIGGQHFVKTVFLVITLSLFAISVIVRGDDIRIPIGTQTPESDQIARPVTGATKLHVKGQFGAPIKESLPKGNPPISSWEYAEFIVYFEGDHVIHSVVKPTLHESKEIIIETTDEMSEDDLKPN